jgi:hypothetical protein
VPRGSRPLSDCHGGTREDLNVRLAWTSSCEEYLHDSGEAVDIGLLVAHQGRYQPMRVPLGLGKLSPSVFWWRPAWRRRGRGEVLLVDCRRDHVDRCLNLHYSLDVIFRLPFLVTAREDFSQGRALVEQLVSRFLKDLHLVLGHDHLSISSDAKF